MGKFSKILLTAAIGAGVCCSGPESQSENIKSELSKTLFLSKEQLVASKEKKEKSQTFSVDLKKDLENTPLGWSKSMIKERIGDLLGYEQTYTIIQQLNPAAKGKNAWMSYHSLPDQLISVPLIYPELKEYFPENLAQLWKNQTFAPYEQKITTQNLIVITRCQNNNAALAYYKSGKLTLATYVSLGTTSNKTVEGLYPLKHDSKYRRSQKYKNAPMPYSMHFTGGYFMHQGESNGKDKSHGCVRVPGLYQKWLYEKLPRDGQILLKGLYKPTLSKKSKKSDSKAK